MVRHRTDILARGATRHNHFRYQKRMTVEVCGVVQSHAGCVCTLRSVVGGWLRAWCVSAVTSAVRSAVSPIAEKQKKTKNTKN